MEMKPQLKTSKDGRRTLYVLYTSTCWDEAIEAAEKQFDIQNDKTVTIIALPGGSPVFCRFPPGGRDRGVKLTAS